MRMGTESGIPNPFPYEQTVEVNYALPYYHYITITKYS